MKKSAKSTIAALSPLEVAFAIVDAMDVFPPFTGGASETGIAREEKALKIIFPPSYRAFLLRFGAQQDEGFEGIDLQFGNRISKRCKIFWKEGLPKNYVTVFSEGLSCYALNVDEVNDDGEFAVYQYSDSDPADSLERIAESFEELFIAYFGIEKKVKAQLKKSRK